MCDQNVWPTFVTVVTGIVIIVTGNSDSINSDSRNSDRSNSESSNSDCNNSDSSNT